jgi:hypothetical protein
MLRVVVQNEPAAPERHSFSCLTAAVDNKIHLHFWLKIMEIEIVYRL